MTNTPPIVRLHRYANHEAMASPERRLYELGSACLADGLEATSRGVELTIAEWSLILRRMTDAERRYRETANELMAERCKYLNQRRQR